MDEPVTLAVLTRDDVIRAGACASGVDAWLLRRRPVPTAMTVADALSRCRDAECAYVSRAASLDGYGYCNGYGNGYGYGYGYGDGDGDGDGNGYGDGYGYGNGYGYGYGDGDGDGDGDGNGYGDGYGNGYGYGDGDGEP